MAYEAAEVQRLPDTYIQYLVEQINDYLSNTVWLLHCYLSQSIHNIVINNIKLN